MSLPTMFKLKDSKPDKDFVEWNKLMSRNFNQDQYYNHSHPFIRWVEKKRITTISNFINEHLTKFHKTDPVILEVGCGAGHVLEEIISKVKTKNLFGLDPLEEWLEIAKQKIGNNVKLINAFAEGLPFENSSMDYIVCSEVLEHVIDPRVVLNELKRTIKESGLIIISIPDEIIINKLKGAIDFLKLYNKFFPNIVKHNEWHIHEFNLSMFKECIPVGLIIQNIKIIPTNLLPLRYVITLRKNKN